MTQRECSRPFLEAALIARAGLDPSLRCLLGEMVDVDRLSPAAQSLLGNVLYPDDCGMVFAETKGQRELLDRVGKLTVDDVLYWEVQALVVMVNDLPVRSSAKPAWERYLDAIGHSAA